MFFGTVLIQLCIINGHWTPVDNDTAVGVLKDWSAKLEKDLISVVLVGNVSAGISTLTRSLYRINMFLVRSNFSFHWRPHRLWRTEGHVTSVEARPVDLLLPARSILFNPLQARSTIQARSSILFIFHYFFQLGQGHCWIFFPITHCFIILHILNWMILKYYQDWYLRIENRTRSTTPALSAIVSNPPRTGYYFGKHGILRV